MRQYNHPDQLLRKKFGTRVRELRGKLGLSQEQLGFNASIHRTYIGAVERGEQNVSLDNIGRIAKKLKVSLSELFKF
ncbi:helix-turn-helix transcriptional regulator [Candidatus Woesebacteria bacterium]|nr:helix-turn-helix transcriptional regulator [Candidatus Woesebacteria bacterium]